MPLCGCYGRRSCVITRLMHPVHFGAMTHFEPLSKTEPSVSCLPDFQIKINCAEGRLDNAAPAQWPSSRAPRPGHDEGWKFLGFYVLYLFLVLLLMASVRDGRGHRTKTCETHECSKKSQKD